MNLEEKLNKFTNKISEKPKIIVIYGPTACWKTDLSLKIAKLLDTEIISTDSRQIYKLLDIWTWKITHDEMWTIIHHMIDIINIPELYSVWEFKKVALKLIDDIHKKWKIPILCWWTWLYIDSLIYDFDIPEVVADWDLRQKLEEEAKEYWNEYVYNKLLEIDREYALTLHPNNVQYVIRALEVKLITWKSKRESKKEKTLNYETLFLTPYKNDDRKTLYEKIDSRVQKMFDDWLIEETQNLLQKYDKLSPWLQTIWYKEVLDYLDWVYTLDQTIELVQQLNRNYAKRQLTWFRKYENK